jgi:hypothetical protein
MHVQTPDATVDDFDLARVYPRSSSKTEWPIGFEDGSRAAQGAGWAIENGEHSVTRDVDESPTEACQLRVGRVIVLV